MSTRKSMVSTCITVVLFFALICAEQATGERVSGKTWSCPKDWKAFTNAEPYDCLWAGVAAASSFTNAQDLCKAMDSDLVTIQSEAKYNFIKDMIKRSNKQTAWIGLRKESRHSPTTWWTRHGEIEMKYTPEGFERNGGYYSYGRLCVVMNSYGNWQWQSCSSDYRMLICEKHIECQTGRFGPRCERECHCHGHNCDSSLIDVNCPFGCLPGWMGDACDIRREKASLAYHCIHSSSSGMRASIEIHTKGISYRHIQAIDENDTAYPWCDETVLYMSDNEKFVKIDIQVTDTAISKMKDGQCAGKHVKGDLYQWYISLQEWEGIFMPDDQVLMVQCNFSDAETLSRSGETHVNGKKASTASRRKETKEKIVLEVADPATEGKLESISVGAPVILKIQFGLSKGSLVESIFPYDCEATTADGTQRLSLLDDNGCPVEGSPVQPFVAGSKNKTIVTPWFPYFTFKGYSEVLFQCSFIFCHDNSCDLGCGNWTNWQNEGLLQGNSTGDF